MLEQLPADPTALGILILALGWALSELRAHRKHRAEIDRERVSIEEERLKIEERRASALEDLGDQAERGVEHLEKLERRAQELGHAAGHNGPTGPS